MAHYARLGVNNVVVRVDIIDNSKITTSGGIEKDALAFEHLFDEFGAGIWVKCSFNTAEGVHSLGGHTFKSKLSWWRYDEVDPWYYDTANDIFCKGRPKDKDGESCSSWTLNTTSGVWESSHHKTRVYQTTNRGIQTLFLG
jgi:hypothetical protein